MNLFFVTNSLSDKNSINLAYCLKDSKVSERKPFFPSKMPNFEVRNPNCGKIKPKNRINARGKYLGATFSRPWSYFLRFSRVVCSHIHGDMTSRRLVNIWSLRDPPATVCFKFQNSIFCPLIWSSKCVTPFMLPQLPPKLHDMRDLERREENSKHPRKVDMWKLTWNSEPIGRVQKLINSHFESVIPAIIAADGGRDGILLISSVLWDRADVYHNFENPPS